jgi:hypothetical protein
MVEEQSKVCNGNFAHITGEYVYVHPTVRNSQAQGHASCPLDERHYGLRSS